MRQNKFIYILKGIVVATLVLVLWANKYWDGVIRYQIEKVFLSKVEDKILFKKDIDGDGGEDTIRFAERVFPSRHYCDEGFFEVRKKDGRTFCSNILGSEFLWAKVEDINNDGELEMVSKWGDGNAINLCIYKLKTEDLKELLSAGGRDVVVFDIDKDNCEEIIEYWRDYDRPFNTFVANIYRWNGTDYVSWKQDVPVKVDPVKGDKLFLGKGKIAVLK